MVNYNAPISSLAKNENLANNSSLYVKELITDLHPIQIKKKKTFEQLISFSTFVNIQIPGLVLVSL